MLLRFFRCIGGYLGRAESLQLFKEKGDFHKDDDFGNHSESGLCEGYAERNLWRGPLLRTIHHGYVSHLKPNSWGGVMTPKKRWRCLTVKETFAIAAICHMKAGKLCVKVCVELALCSTGGLRHRGHELHHRRPWASLSLWVFKNSKSPARSTVKWANRTRKWGFLKVWKTVQRTFVYKNKRIFHWNCFTFQNN